MVVISVNNTILLFILVAIVPSNAYEDNEYKFNSLNRFSFEFYKETSKLNPNKSVVVSPLTSQMILGLLSTAAKGSTQTEIFDALHINDTETIKSTFKKLMTELKLINEDALNIANKIYIKDGDFYELESEFKSIAKDSFFSDVENIDFSKNEQAAEIINNWVKKETKNKIHDLISSDSINEDTRTILINSIYFQGSWKYPFNKTKTSKELFHINTTNSIYVDTMHMEKGLPYDYDDKLKAQFLGLPYNSEESILIIALPDDPNNLSQLENEIANYDFNEILQQRAFYSISVKIPKFKIETSIDLEYIFKKLGIEQIFDENKADLRGILKGNEKLYVSEAVHKALIDVDEEGTVAAAAAGINFVLASSGSDFIANHPFLYYLINKGKIIFCGKYLGN